MGVSLPKPVMTRLQDHYGNAIFRSGSCCVNGYRERMEDAHLVYLKEDWGFFGVFDGHVNDKCSEYLEGAWNKALDSEPSPKTMTDDRMKELTLQIDQEWMDSKAEGGSTGTFFIARKDGGTVHLQVGNVGDSRVVACINGTCRPLTVDHKPDNEGERQRIEECGGRVEANRVDGSLAVSRAFGDRDYKKNAAGQLDQKVIALADVTHADITFDSTDFVLLCCDGVFEGNFSNEEVVDFVKRQLLASKDLPEIAFNVCSEAIDRGSRDNISCVIVQFTDGADYSVEPHRTVIPGPFDPSDNGTFRSAYDAMSQKCGLSVAQVLEMRYDALRAQVERSAIEEAELAVFHDGPNPSLKGEERTAYFEELFAQLGVNDEGNQYDSVSSVVQSINQGGQIPLEVVLAMLGEREGLEELARNREMQRRGGPPQ